MTTDFIFKGDWETEIKLDTHTVLQNDKFFQYSKPVKEKLLKGLVDIRIFDGFDDYTDPTIEQLNTISFIKENQKIILEKLFVEIKEVVYPFMKTQIDDEEHWFPKIEIPNDLEKVLGLTSFDILRQNKDENSYFSINFEATWDNEHGFNALFHKDRIISTGEAGGFNIFKIYEECNLNPQIEIYEYNHWDDKIFDFITPNPKYGKLKPNQKSSNERLPYRLIRNGLEEKLYSYISNGLIEIDYDGPGISLLATALQIENLNITEFLIENKIKNFNGVENALSQMKNENLKNKVEKYCEENK